MEWINVKDKIPDNNVDVLCFVHRKSLRDEMTFEQHVGHKPQNQKFWIVGNHFSFDIGEVTHWMPLPPPPTTNPPQQ